MFSNCANLFPLFIIVTSQICFSSSFFESQQSIIGFGSDKSTNKFRAKILEECLIKDGYSVIKKIFEDTFYEDLHPKPYAQFGICNPCGTVYCKRHLGVDDAWIDSDGGFSGIGCPKGHNLDFFSDEYKAKDILSSIQLAKRGKIF